MKRRQPRAGPVFAAGMILLLFSVSPGLAQSDFTDATAEAGLTGVIGYRVSVADINGDGYPDLLLHRQCFHGTGDVRNKQYVYMNVQGDEPGNPYSRKFTDFTAESGVRANREGNGDGRQSDGVILADVDNDGDMDAFFLVYVHESYTLDEGKADLMLNDGDGHFTLAPNSRFHLEPVWNSLAAVFLDYDNDGNIDLSTGNWYWNGQPTTQRLYRGHGDGTFTEVSTESGIGAQPMVLYALANWDHDDDGWMDLFAPQYDYLNPSLFCVHWRNNGDGTFTQYQDTSRYTDHCGWFSLVANFGTMPRDYDNDGDIDFATIYVHGGSDRGKYSGPVRNDEGVFTFDWSRITNRGVEDPDTAHDGDHHACWLDYNGDTLPDLALTECFYGNNRLYLFEQQPDHTFDVATVATGLDGVNAINEETNNVIPLDYDRDGDEDLIVGFGDDTTGVQLWRNEVGNANRWISVRLEGGGAPGQANRAGIGARIELTAGGVTQTREVSAGIGHSGPQAPLDQTFGLADASMIDSLRVRWPNAAHTVTERRWVGVDRFLTVREVCNLPADASNLGADKDGPDLALHWDDPGVAGLSWNVYRGTGPDPAGWGAPHGHEETDRDPGTPGIQYADEGAMLDELSYYYLVHAVDDCGESLREGS